MERQLQIAVVDDDPAVLRALDRLLRSHDCLVKTFGSAKEFLDALPGLALDCLLLDVQMPETSGVELYAQLCAMKLEVPVIFISAHEDPQTEQHLRRQGAAGFFYKPLRSQVLWTAIGSALARNTPLCP